MTMNIFVRSYYFRSFASQCRNVLRARTIASINVFSIHKTLPWDSPNPLSVFISTGNRDFLNCRSLTTSKNRCWKCSSVVTERDLVCLTCGCVQEPRDNLNNFELFKENPHFDIDIRNLTVKFRRLQTLLHPDKFATGTEQEQKYSLEQSSRVNRAYQILKKPLERASYLLQLFGKPLTENEISMAPEFLADVLEINEQIDAAKSADTIESIRHSNNAKLDVLYGELSQTFKEKNITRAREITAKLKYYVTIDERLKKAEEEMGISRDD